MRKAWNIPVQTVFSLATFDREGILNMNICTYVTGVSMTPKRFAIAVYKNTKTLENLKLNDLAYLQVLNEVHAPLVKLLGKQSGLKVNKYARLRKNNCLQRYEDIELLTSLNAFMQLKMISSNDVGDHILCVFDVMKSRSFSEEAVLTNQYLMAKGFIL